MYSILTQDVFVNPYSAGIDLRRQILTSQVDSRAERLKYAWG